MSSLAERVAAALSPSHAVPAKTLSVFTTTAESRLGPDRNATGRPVLIASGGELRFGLQQSLPFPRGSTKEPEAAADS